MGYYTTFDLTNRLSEQEVKTLAEIQPGYFDYDSEVDALTDGYFNAKWYD